MSHVADMQLEILDLQALKNAATRLGLKFQENKKTYKWFGSHVGDYPLPEGIAKADLGKCEHSMSIEGNAKAYEIGVLKKKNGKGYHLLWDFWQGGYGLQEKIGKDGQKLKQMYATEAAKRQMKREGYRFKEKTDTEGNIYLTFTA